MKTHAPAISGLPICGESSRWRGKRAQPYRMASGVPTCRLCLTALSGSPELRAKRWIAHARHVVSGWASRHETPQPKGEVMRGTPLRGKASRGKNGDMENVNVRFAPEVLREVDSLALEWRERTGLSATRSDVVRMAVTALLSQRMADKAKATP